MIQHSNQAFSSTEQQTAFNISSERYKPTESDNYKSLNDAHDEFEEFDGDPPTLEEALEAADVPKLKSTLGDLRRKTKKDQGSQRSQYNSTH